jgi:hypothetical protein
MERFHDERGRKEIGYVPLPIFENIVDLSRKQEKEELFGRRFFCMKLPRFRVGLIMIEDWQRDMNFSHFRVINIPQKKCDGLAKKGRKKVGDDIFQFLMQDHRDPIINRVV